MLHDLGRTRGGRVFCRLLQKRRPERDLYVWAGGGGGGLFPPESTRSSFFTAEAYIPTIVRDSALLSAPHNAGLLRGEQREPEPLGCNRGNGIKRGGTARFVYKISKWSRGQNGIGLRHSWF